MYTGQIYHHGLPITVGEAVSRGLITVDGDGNIWLAQDASHRVKINGDLRLE